MSWFPKDATCSSAGFLRDPMVWANNDISVLFIKHFKDDDILFEYYNNYTGKDKLVSLKRTIKNHVNVVKIHLTGGIIPNIHFKQRKTKVKLI